MLQIQPASFDKLSPSAGLRGGGLGIGHLPEATKKRPHPEPVEGRTIVLQPFSALEHFLANGVTPPRLWAEDDAMVMILSARDTRQPAKRGTGGGGKARLDSRWRKRAG